MAVVTTVTPSVVVPAVPLVQHVPGCCSNRDLLLIQERHRALKERIRDPLASVPAAVSKIVSGEGSLLEEIRQLKDKVAQALAALEEDQAALKKVQSMQGQLEAGLAQASKDHEQFLSRCSEMDQDIENQIGSLQNRMEAEVQKQMQASRASLEKKFETLESSLQQKSESVAASVQGMEESVSKSLKSQTLKLTTFEERIGKAEDRDEEMSKLLQAQKASLEALDDALRSARSSLEGNILKEEQARKDGDSQLQKALQKETDRISDLAQAHAQMGEQHTSLERRLYKLEDGDSQLQRVLQKETDRISDLAQAHAQMGEQHTSLERRVYKLEDDLPKLQVGRQDLVELRTLVQQIDGRTKDSPSIHASLTQMEQRMANLKGTQEHTAKMAEENNSKASELRGKIAEVEAKTNSLAELRWTCDDLSTKVTSCTALLDTCKAMKVQSQEVFDTSSKLVPKVDSIEGRLAELGVKQRDLESRHTEKLPKAEFQDELKKLKDLLQENKDAAETLRKDFMQTRTALQAAVS